MITIKLTEREFKALEITIGNSNNKDAKRVFRRIDELNEKFGEKEYCRLVDKIYSKLYHIKYEEKTETKVIDLSEWLETNKLVGGEKLRRKELYSADYLQEKPYYYVFLHSDIGKYKIIDDEGDFLDVVSGAYKYEIIVNES